jgi:hypothetical protein
MFVLVKNCKCSENPITNSNPIFSHSYASQYTYNKHDVSEVCSVPILAIDLHCTYVYIYSVYIRSPFISEVNDSGPVMIAEPSKAWTVFARSDAVIVGSNPASGMDVWCVYVCTRACLFCVCVVVYLGRGLATGRSLVQEVLPAVYRTKREAETSTS